MPAIDGAALAHRPQGAIAPKLVCLIRCLALAKPVESVIHADQDSGRFRMGVEVTNTIKTVRVEYSMIVRAEVHVVAFQKRRPAPRKHPFNATTGRPTCSGPITEITEVKTSKGYVCTGFNPGNAALTVEQPAGRPRIAEAGRQGVEPINVEVSRATKTVGEESSIPMEACPIKHIAGAKHPAAGELIIAANLTAAIKARIASRDFQTSESAIALAKYPADVPADVTSCPSNWRRRGRYVSRRSSSWQIGCQCRSCSQTNCRGSEQHQRMFLHHGSSLILQQARGPIYLAHSLTPKFVEILYSGITRMLLCVGVIKMIRILCLATARLPSMRRNVRSSQKRTFRQGEAHRLIPAKIASWSPRLSLLHQPLILSARR